MATEIKVPALGESVSEATVAKWFKAVGDAVVADQPLVELETDKVTVEVNAPVSGVLLEIMADLAADVEVGAVLGLIAEGAAATPGKPAPAEKPSVTAPPTPAAAAPTVAAAPTAAAPSAAAPSAGTLSPAVRKLIEENNLDAERIPASGKDGRLTKGDVLAYIESGAAKTPRPTTPPAAAPSAVPPPPTALPTAPPAPAAPAPASPTPVVATSPAAAAPREERVKMTRLRKLVAQRLKDAQNTAAMLTTFNEIDMTAANELRSKYRESFEKKFGVRLGVMSLFCKACVDALKEFPAVNAEIDGDELVYKNHYDIAIAVSSPQGLVVPVVRDCDRLSMAGIEQAINDLGKRARAGGLKMEEMQGGTFTITNGGVFGSLMSTPILNPPQVGILGMHKIEQRPIVMADGSIQARPMMYVALSYDHRIIDGREAVSFLVRVKQCVEDPERLLIEC